MSVAEYIHPGWADAARRLRSIRMNHDRCLFDAYRMGSSYAEKIGTVVEVGAPGRGVHIGNGEYDGFWLITRVDLRWVYDEMRQKHAVMEAVYGCRVTGTDAS